MLPKFHDVLASAVRFISTHCTAIVSFVLMNGPVKMFTAEALDEMMAGTLLADVSEPLYVNTLAPDNDKAVAVDDGVIEPVIDIVAADVQDMAAVALPTTDPDTLILAADVSTAIAADPPVILPVTITDVPEKDIPTFGDEPIPPVIFPIIVKLPAVCAIPLLPLGAFIDNPAPPVTLPITTVFPALETKASFNPVPADPPVPPIKSPTTVIVPPDVFDIHLVFVTPPDVVPLKVLPDIVKLQLPLWLMRISAPTARDCTLLPRLRVTVPVVAVTVIKLIAPGTNEVLAAFLVQLPLIPAVLKLNVPPAVIPVPDVFLRDNT
jgi:hypothetical protein